jgi:hypothetical protein
MSWRWDQGRLAYFQYDEIKRIALALLDFNGQRLPEANEPDTLRAMLAGYSDQPFSPADYTVWRNYKRVFGCQLLATEMDRRVICTDVCRSVATGSVDIDDYLLFVANRFYYPSPIFEGYNPRDPQVFPIAAILKFLLSRVVRSEPSFLTTQVISEYLIGNDIRGTEPLNEYVNLNATNHREPENIVRQIRELLRFISQFSFLKWQEGRLYLELADSGEAFAIERIIQPLITRREIEPALEVIKMGGNYGESGLGVITAAASITPADQEFTEGNKKRVTHLRSERSRKLIELYFENAENPEVCDMCRMNTHQRYPWANRIIEVHHLLPLSSPIRVERNTSSLRDLAGLCPSCHRATHKFYTRWLGDNHLDDFRNYEEAQDVYSLAKHDVVLH